MHLAFKIILPIVLLAWNAVSAQNINILLPDATITAGRILRGDGDTYGLGDWKCVFSLSLQDTFLSLEGEISFTENANDFTTIVGSYRQRIAVGELERCRHCSISLSEDQGMVKGPNIGARGYRWFNGKGLIRRASIRTDVFGTDAGQIGGRIQFAPLHILIDCSMARTDRPGIRTGSIEPIYGARANSD